ncbi:MAG: ankyrin repeat domain-containing protein [Alphaproteobacteria bacterium]
MMVYILVLLMTLFSGSAQAQIDDYAAEPIQEVKEQKSVAGILRSNDKETLKKLLDEGLDVNQRDDEGDTMLVFTLANNDNLEMAKILLEAGADVNAPSQRDGITPLLVATSMANEVQKQTIKIYGSPDSINQSKIVGDNLIENIQAQMEYAAAIVKLLIEYGVDVDRETPYGTPLMNASTNEWNANIIDMLLKAGADVNKKDRNGRTALFYASAYNCNNILSQLMAADADIDVKDAFGKTYMEAEKQDLVIDPEQN